MLFMFCFVKFNLDQKRKQNYYSKERPFFAGIKRVLGQNSFFSRKVIKGNSEYERMTSRNTITLNTKSFISLQTA